MTKHSTALLHCRWILYHLSHQTEAPKGKKGRKKRGRWGRGKRGGWRGRGGKWWFSLQVGHVTKVHKKEWWSWLSRANRSSRHNEKSRNRFINICDIHIQKKICIESSGINGIKWCWDTCLLLWKKNKVNLQPHTISQSDFRWIADLNVKQNYKSIGQNIRKYNLERKKTSNKTQKMERLKYRTHKLDYLKI